eukprot:TRINITY_DN16074_c1_g1_i1.p1 TRINITY_DN16074_c1_g1~~TRINITY_DN16074_c1_g1_i1.p1  ORF type:complete len:1068 (+),score=311.44 TRINITY_DN16074_c1_g1_i1:96-3206(+)
MPPTSECSAAAAQDGPVQTIGVYCRLRPCVGEEEQQEMQEEGAGVRVDRSRGVVYVQRDPYTDAERDYRVTKAFGGDATQDDIFEALGRPAVEAVFAGRHNTILAYGQTGGGKTYTLTGGDEEDKGLLPRTLAAIFDRCAADEAAGGVTHQVTLQVVQIYKEAIQDLLNLEGGQSLGIRENAEQGIYVPGLRRMVLRSAEEAAAVLTAVAAARVTATTVMNAESSRSHVCYFLRLRRSTVQCDASGLPECGDGSSEDEPPGLLGQLTVADLAGSERIKKTNSQGVRREEARHINLSLSMLGNVVHALSDPRATHVPYRDSKLTRLLQDSLGGFGRTSIVLAVGPSRRHVSESNGALLFGQRAMVIEQRDIVHQDADYKALCAHLRRVVAERDAELRRARARIAELEARLRRGEQQQQQQQQQQRGTAAAPVAAQPAAAAPAAAVLASPRVGPAAPAPDPPAPSPATAASLQTPGAPPGAGRGQDRGAATPHRAAEILTLRAQLATMQAAAEARCAGLGSLYERGTQTDAPPAAAEPTVRSSPPQSDAAAGAAPAAAAAAVAAPPACAAPCEQCEEHRIAAGQLRGRLRGAEVEKRMLELRLRELERGGAPAADAGVQADACNGSSSDGAAPPPTAPPFAAFLSALAARSGAPGSPGGSRSLFEVLDEYTTPGEGAARAAAAAGQKLAPQPPPLAAMRAAAAAAAAVAAVPAERRGSGATQCCTFWCDLVQQMQEVHARHFAGPTAKQCAAAAGAAWERAMALVARPAVGAESWPRHEMPFAAAALELKASDPVSDTILRFAGVSFDVVACIAADCKARTGALLQEATALVTALLSALDQVAAAGAELGSQLSKAQQSCASIDAERMGLDGQLQTAQRELGATRLRLANLERVYGRQRRADALHAAAAVVQRAWRRRWRRRRAESSARHQETAQQLRRRGAQLESALGALQEANATGRIANALTGRVLIALCNAQVEGVFEAAGRGLLGDGWADGTRRAASRGARRASRFSHGGSPEPRQPPSSVRVFTAAPGARRT